MTPGLAALLAPLPLSDFLATHWPAAPFVTHGLASSVAPLTKLPFLQSLDALLDVWGQPLQVHLPDLADEASAIDASPGDAHKLFKNRMALLFNNAHRLSPVLTEWLTAIHRDLGLPAMTHGRCMVYATPDGKGTAPHFDQNVNFVLQLRGTKTWWVAPNESVVNPLERHTLGLPMEPELSSYADAPMPEHMPEGERIVLRPGSMLFVPRGFWHRTEATGEALALNFTFSQPTWLDLFTTALRSRLALSPEWRELADGVGARSPERRAAAAERFDALLLELTQDIPNWRADGILGATEGDPG